MFTLTYEGQVLYDPRSPDLYIRDPSVHLAVDEAGSLSFTIDAEHPYLSYLQTLKGRLELKSDDDVIYRGRILSDTQNFDLSRDIVSEGQLACLNDSIVAPFEFPGDYADDEDYESTDNVVEFWLGKLLDSHNSQVEEEQQILLGSVTVTDSNNYIARSSEDYMTTWECLTSKLRDSALGGHFLVRYEDDGTYLDYVADYPLLNTQSVEFAKNILDLQDEIDGSEVYTVIMPIGSDGLTIEDLDDGFVTTDIVKEGAVLYSQAGIEKYGRITSIQTWDDVTVAANLRTKAAALLADSGIYMARTITVTAVDLHCTDDDISALRVGRYTPVYSDPHGIDVSYAITELDPDIQNPGNTRITLGASVQTMTGHTSNEIAQLEAKITSIYLNLGTITSQTVIEVDVEYYSSDSSSELTGGEWSTDAPDWDEAKYIWTRTKTVTAGGTTSYSDPVCISGSSGEDGLGITDITEQYYLSSSSEECVDGEWSDTCPDWVDGYYIWTRSHITWSDGSETDTTPVLAAALNDLYTLTSTLTQAYSSLEQTASEITAIVGTWTETIGTSDDGTVITIAEAVSTLQQTAESISLTIESNTWLTTDDAAELYATKSELTATAESIQLSVQSDIEDAIASITIDASTIRLDASAIAWESTYSSMTEDGTLTCVNAVLNSATVYGTVISENEDWIVSMTSGMINFYYDNTYYGGMSSTYWWEDSGYAGIRMLLGDAGTYIAFEYGDPTSMETVDPSYLINFGLDPDDITQRHIFYYTTFFSGAVTAASYIYAQANIRVTNGVYLQWYNSSGSASSMIYLSSADIFYLGSGSYNTYVRGNPLYLGSTSYATYLYGSSITVSGATTFVSAVTCSSTLTVASYLYAQSYIRITNGKYIQWYNSSSSAVSLIYFNSSNVFNLGSTSYVTYLYGSSITVSGAITFSGAVTCSSTLSVASATTLRSTLSVSGAATFAKAITISNGIYINWANSSGTAERNLPQQRELF